MAVTSFDGQFSFKQDSLARLGARNTPKMNADQYAAFQNSPFMQGVRKTEDLCWTFTCDRDEKRKKSDPTFKPTDDDFSSPKAHEYDRCINYYKVLGVDEYAPLEEVKKAYKKLSLVYHPDKTNGLSDEQKEEYASIFIELKNAYLTLGDHATRRQYDRERDRDKASFEVNGFKPKTRAHFDATEVLKKLQEMQKPPGKLVEVPMAVKLEKFFYGGHKAIKRQKRVKDFGGFSHETRIYRVDVPRGAAEPHEVTFRQGGDHHEDTRPDTVRFKLSSKPHAAVERKGEDLYLRSRVGLGQQAHREPYLQAEAPTVAGRHLLLWGRNPFYLKTPSGQGELHVQVKGEGLTAAGSLHLTCRAGLAAPTPATSSTSRAPAASPSKASAASPHDDQVVVKIKHMQTEAQLFLRVSKTATIGDVRARIMELADLPRGATVRMLQQFSGGYTPFPDKQPIGAIRSMNCAGTAWTGVSFSPTRSKEFLQDLLAASETPAMQAKLASVSRAAASGTSNTIRLQAEVWSSLTAVLPEYGLEPLLSVMQERVALALQQVRGLPGAEELARRIDDLSNAGKASERKESLQSRGSSGSARLGLREFLQMHSLGPPGGFHAATPSTSSTAPRHGHGGLCEAPAMLRRLARQQQGDATCEVLLEPFGEPMTLFTRPTCSVVFYSNLHQPTRSSSSSSSCGKRLAPEATFAASISSPPCAKKQAHADWVALKASLVPLLRLTAFHMFRAYRGILPRPLANSPADPGDSSSRGSPPMPWKRLGDEAFKHGDYFTAASLYTRCLEESSFEEPKAEAAVFSNRSACLAKAGHFQASREDALRALELRPDWGRAWSRIGFASSKLGEAKQAVEAYRKAVALDASGANVDALAQLVKQLQHPDVDMAHAEKESGNTALRGNDFGMAVACYTVGIALIPPEVQASVPEGAVPDDEHALLRSVLYSNRAAAFCRLKTWAAARSDAQHAVDKKGDFVKARNRLGSALLGCSQMEKAYVEFAHALRIEPNNSAALKGRQACISLMPLWRSLPAKRRSRERFGVDLWRPKGTSKVYAISDIHFDHKCNEEWAHRIDDFDFQEDVLIVAGNACDTRNALVRALTTLKAKFRRVFYVPGNHELWMNPSEVSKYPDSLAKLLGLMETCDELGVDCFPSAVSEDVFIVPLLSWYSAEFDEKDPFPDPNANFDHQCRWPLDPDTQVWKYMLKLNEAHLQHPYHGTVITFSHFLPSRSLPFSAFGRAAKAMGCEELNDQVKSIRVRNRVHVYGHSQRHFAQYEDGILYVNHHHGLEGGQAERSPLFLIHDGKAIVKKEVDIYSGPIRS
eukprot:TRINITY_DN18998_c0_g1_i1.p1 TRINITY_DN18998_c0_g1~~TRINITY_DN18998_c0_g1_i1.p1  ORF type:complete len:1338 (-),score=302.52 TRINITY_DN18998_c0_g1_i1:96-4043(-)